MMQRAVILVSLVLGSAWILQAVLPEPHILPQENFDLDQFMGKWYEVAVHSTCPHFMQRKKGNPFIISLQLHHVASEGNFTMTSTKFRNGSCKQMPRHYTLTDTPGRFFHHSAKYSADVDTFVVRSSYDEFALLLHLSTEKPSGNKSTIAKLFSRTRSVRPAVLEDFKTLTRQHGMDDEAVIVSLNKGECVAGEQEIQPVITRPQRRKRAVALPLAADEDGPSDDSALFIGTEACNAAPDKGPCSGLRPRYFYNSSAMSCQIFRYGGCMGNQNNFESERVCLQRCRTEGRRII